MPCGIFALALLFWRASLASGSKIQQKVQSMLNVQAFKRYYGIRIGGECPLHVYFVDGGGSGRFTASMYYFLQLVVDTQACTRFNPVHTCVVDPGHQEPI